MVCNRVIPPSVFSGPANHTKMQPHIVSTRGRSVLAAWGEPCLGVRRIVYEELTSLKKKTRLQSDGRVYDLAEPFKWGDGWGTHRPTPRSSIHCGAGTFFFLPDRLNYTFTCSEQRLVPDVSGGSNSHSIPSDVLALLLALLPQLALVSRMVDLLDLVLREIDVPDLEVSFQPALLRARRDDDRAGMSLVLIGVSCRGRRNSPLGLGPREQDLRGLLAVLVRNLLHGLVDGSAGPRRDGDQGRVPLGDDVLRVQVVEQGLLGLDHVGVQKDLVDDGLDLGVLEQLLEIVDREAAVSVARVLWYSRKAEAAAERKCDGRRG